MKSKYIIITVLIIGIVFIQYKIFNISQSKSENIDPPKEEGSVKGAKTEKIDLQLPEIKDVVLPALPEKKENISDPEIHAKNYILIHENTNYPLIEKDASASVPIASTTKIMTAIIALENYNLDDVVEISQNAATQIGSDVFLQIGEKISVKNLLYALLIKSGNDSAMALAEYMKPYGKDSFVLKMNEKAKYLNMKNTELKDPAGLDDSGKSSAFDLAIIASYSMKNPVFSEIVKTPLIDITSTDGKFAHKLDSSNRLIKPDEPLFYQNAIGIKTGYTPEAGHCLVSAAKLQNTTLIAVVLNTTESTNDASAKESKKLLEWGFSSFNYKD